MSPKTCPRWYCKFVSPWFYHQFLVTCRNVFPHICCSCFRLLLGHSEVNRKDVDKTDQYQTITKHYTALPVCIHTIIVYLGVCTRGGLTSRLNMSQGSFSSLRFTSIFLYLRTQTIGRTLKSDATCFAHCTQEFSTTHCKQFAVYKWSPRADDHLRSLYYHNGAKRAICCPAI